MPHVASFANRLVDWYDAHQRDLPWRRHRDAWAIWVSEIMLQQTRVEAVREPYSRFLERYPTPQAWAGVSEDELLGAWRGLGYYRRARLLRDGAKAVVEQHDGEVPSELGAIAALPGIGKYTAGAIASIAFGHAVPAIDGNVERVTARHRGIDDNVKRTTGARQVRAAVDDWLDPTRAGDFNQAMMELGATVCTPRQPRCPTCPIQTDCVAHREHRQADWPRLPERKPMVEIATRMLWLEHEDGRIAGRRIDAGAINAGQVDLLGPGPLVPIATATELQAWLYEHHGTIDVGPLVTTIRHSITHHRIEVRVHLAKARLPSTVRELEWLTMGDSVPWTTIARKASQRARPAPGLPGVH